MLFAFTFWWTMRGIGKHCAGLGWHAALPGSRSQCPRRCPCAPRFRTGWPAGCGTASRSRFANQGCRTRASPSKPGTRARPRWSPTSWSSSEGKTATISYGASAAPRTRAPALLPGHRRTRHAPPPTAPQPRRPPPTEQARVADSSPGKINRTMSTRAESAPQWSIRLLCHYLSTLST